jgi:hypothetical protein
MVFMEHDSIAWENILESKFEIFKLFDNFRKIDIDELNEGGGNKDIDLGGPTAR